jgi:hypothetical protein
VQDLQACDFSRFEIPETVLDETVRRAMENLRFKYVEKEEERFASLEEDNYVLSTQELRNHLENYLFPTKKIKLQLYKINVYNKGGFFSPHVDTPVDPEALLGKCGFLFPL